MKKKFIVEIEAIDENDINVFAKMLLKHGYVTRVEPLIALGGVFQEPEKVLDIVRFLFWFFDQDFTKIKRVRDNAEKKLWWSESRQQFYTDEQLRDVYAEEI